MTPQIIHSSNQSFRLPNLHKELKEQGIDEFEIWEGIHDISSTPRSINLSHKQIVEYAQLAGWNDVLIFENDIRFCGEGSFKYFLENKPEVFDLYIGGIYLGDIEENNMVKHFTGMHCYIVAKRFYETFLSTDNSRHIDIALARLGEYYVSNPFTSVQYNGLSSNTRKDENYDSMFQNRVLYNNFQL